MKNNLEKLTIDEIDVFADIAKVVFKQIDELTERKFNSRDVPELIHKLACEFQTIFKGRDWSEDDYLGTIEDWTEAHAKIGLKRLEEQADLYTAK